MSDNDTRNGRMTPREAPPLVERRATARTLLRDVVGRITWRGEAGEVVSQVVVLNISGGGAALLAEDPLPAGQSLRLSLQCAAARMESVDGQVVETSLDASGRRVVHVRFTRWVPLDWLLDKHRERRLWERYPARESRASLSWPEGAAERVVRGELLNISGGGAAFVSEECPPRGVPIFLRLEAGAEDGVRLHAVESRLVTTSVDPSGMRVAHIHFVQPFPMELFELAVDGSR
jgi:hypothetical protein